MRMNIRQHPAVKKLLSKMTMSKDKVVMILLKVYVIGYYSVRLLVAKPFVILIFFIFLYYFASSLGLSKPFTFLELILWLDSLPENSKTTIFTSLITISGFLIAFNIGSATQKQQLMSQMRIESSDDVESFFNEASRNLTSVDIYAKYLLQVAEYIHNNAPATTIEFHLNNVIGRTEEHDALLKRLQEQAIEVHRFHGKYSIIFASSWGVTKKLDKAVEAFTETTDKAWFNTPILQSDDPDIANNFIRQIDIEQYNNYIAAYEINSDVISESVGGLTGTMLGEVTGLNFSLIVNFLKMDNK